MAGVDPLFVIDLLMERDNTPFFFVKNELEKDQSETIRIQLSEHVSFLNKGKMQMTLEGIPENSHVVIDGKETRDIDFDVINIINDFTESAHERDIRVETVNIPELK